MSLADIIGPVIADFRTNQLPPNVTLNGQPYHVSVSGLDNSNGSFLPDGALNAENPNPIAFNFSAADFATVDAQPVEEDEITWSGGDGAVYIVDQVQPSPLGSTLRAICHRKPVPGSSPNDTAQKEMWK